MRYLVLATDYDGTLASHGSVADSTLAVLERVLASGRRLVLVTGRHLPDLKNVFPHLEMFRRVVAENGALLYRPSSREEKLLCEPPPQAFLDLLTERQVPFSAGRGIVATWEPHQESILKAIKDLGVELQVVFNKGAVMVLPSGVNKASGLKAALEELGISPHNVVGAGDAENDHALLSFCECGVAVDNALPFLKQRADLVTKGRNGAGISELCEQLLQDDLAQFDSRLTRHAISLGQRLENGDEDVRVSPHRKSILVAGPSASGKSTAVAGLIEQLAEQCYQFCLVDPEGDFENFAGALSLGTAQERPDPKAILKALESPAQSVIVNLLGIPVAERPQYFAGLLPRLQDLRARTARPHWLIIDEAHHLLPSSWSPANTTVPQTLESTILITVHPDHVSPAALHPVNVVIAIGKDPLETLGAFTTALKVRRPKGRDVELGSGEALVWFRDGEEPPIRVRTIPGHEQRRRHLRQYAVGALSPDESFYFRGPENKLNLRAQNLTIFQQVADGIDDATWIHHLRQGDYSTWFRQNLKDHDLAAEAERIEQDGRLSPIESRQKIKEAIQSRYTAAV
jgi:hydroxymethylpyrimidine pyrophosphatase-like HAD family hydrolase